MIDKKETERQILHIIIGAITVYFIYIGLFDPLVLFLLIIAALLASYLSVKGVKVFVVHWFLKRFEREEQLRAFPGKGLILFFVGSLIALKLFPRDIALASIMILTLGDSVSHLIGGYFGRIKNPINGNSYKLLEGSVAGLIAGFIGAIVFVSPLEALSAAFFAMVAEAVELNLNKKAVDDNLVVPLVAGTAIIAVRYNWLMRTIHFLASFWPF